MNSLKGLLYFPNFLTPNEEKALIKKFASLPWEKVIFHGITAKRQVIHFGLKYHYATRNISETLPIPKFIIPFIKRAAKLLQIDPQNLAEILITDYPIGAGIGWHKDSPVFDIVFGISLLNDCLMKFKKDEKKYNILLERRSAYVLSEEARFEWQHSIAPVKSPRYSITFRTLKK